MDYYIGPDGELYHGLFGKGKPRDDHKYIKREWKNGKWQYTYKQDVKKNATTNAAKNTSTNSKSKTSLSSVGKKISSTVNNAVAKAAIENRGKLSLRTRSAITKGRNAVTEKTSKPKVSKEYQEEVAYNSKKNTFGNYKPISGESLAPSNKSYISKTTSSKQSSKPKVSKEYQEEVAYNSKKNEFGNYKPLTGESLSITDRPYISVTKKEQKAEVKSVLSMLGKRYLDDKNAVKGKNKLADALTAHQKTTERASTLSKLADDISAKLNSGVYKTKSAFDKAFNDMLKAQDGATEAYASARDTGKELVKAIEKNTVEKFWKAHDEYIWSDRADRRTSGARSMTDYYLDQADKIEKGEWTPEVEPPKARNLSVSSFMDGVKEWFGSSEAAAVSEASYQMSRSKDEWYSAMDKADAAKETYDHVVEVVKKYGSHDHTDMYVLNNSWTRYKDAEDYQLMEWARYTRNKAEYDKAMEAYMETPAYALEQKLRPLTNLVDSAEEAIDSGKDWIEDRIDDLGDWLDDLRR